MGKADHPGPNLSSIFSLKDSKIKEDQKHALNHSSPGGPLSPQRFYDSLVLSSFVLSLCRFRHCCSWKRMDYWRLPVAKRTRRGQELYWKKLYDKNRKNAHKRKSTHGSKKLSSGSSVEYVFIDDSDEIEEEKRAFESLDVSYEAEEVNVGPPEPSKHKKRLRKRKSGNRSKKWMSWMSIDDSDEGEEERRAFESHGIQESVHSDSRSEDVGVVPDPMRIIPKFDVEVMVDIAMNWAHPPSDTIDLDTVDRDFFTTLLHSEGILNINHINIGLYLLRKRSLEHPKIFGDRWTTVDYFFWAKMKNDARDFENAKANVKGKGKVNAKEAPVFTPSRLLIKVV